MSTNAAYQTVDESKAKTPKAVMNEALIQPPQYTSFSEVKGKP